MHSTKVTFRANGSKHGLILVNVTRRRLLFEEFISNVIPGFCRTAVVMEMVLARLLAASYDIKQTSLILA